MVGSSIVLPFTPQWQIPSGAGLRRAGKADLATSVRERASCDRWQLADCGFVGQIADRRPAGRRRFRFQKGPQAIKIRHRYINNFIEIEFTQE
jgi:hypothetical protein